VGIILENPRFSADKTTSLFRGAEGEGIYYSTTPIQISSSVSDNVINILRTNSFDRNTGPINQFPMVLSKNRTNRNMGRDPLAQQDQNSIYPFFRNGLIK
jgi:hypothetical protein